jgi:hypothetical protein
MRILTLLLCCLAATANADDVTIRLTGIARGQSYELVYAADGSVTVKPIVVVVVGAPAPNPPGTPPAPPPTPPPSTLQGQVQALTATAMKEGGQFTTAATISAAYGLVATQVEAGNVTLAQVGPALKFITDSVVPNAEVAAWTKWRTAVGGLLATRTGTKADAVAALREVEAGLKAAAGATAATSGQAINWQELFRLLLPILLRLLEKFLNPMGP